MRRIVKRGRMILEPPITLSRTTRERFMTLSNLQSLVYEYVNWRNCAFLSIHHLFIFWNQRFRLCGNAACLTSWAWGKRMIRSTFSLWHGGKSKQLLRSWCRHCVVDVWGFGICFIIFFYLQTRHIVDCRRTCFGQARCSGLLQRVLGPMHWM